MVLSGPSNGKAPHYLRLEHLEGCRDLAIKTVDGAGTVNVTDRKKI